MSIKPLDFNVMIPKTQEVSTTKHAENMKNRNIMQSEFLQKEKRINIEKKKVTDTNKSNQSRIISRDDNKKQHSSNNKNKSDKEKSEDSEKVSNSYKKSVDIRI